MKARVKATGEIVEIENYDIDKLGKLKYFTKDFDIYDENEVEIILERDPDYWTKLEHHAAIAAMQGMLTNPIGFENLRARGGNLQIETALLASEFAHALVEKMKEEREG